MSVIEMKALADKPTLTGERIRLVPFGPEHAEAFYRTTVDDVEGKRLTGTHADFTLEQVRAVAARRPTQKDRLDFAIEDLSTGEFLGDFALLEVDPDNESAMVRLALAPSAQGRGIGPEALRLVIAYGFDEVGLHRIQLDVYDFNERAIKAYEKVGFVHEGRLRDALLWDGEWHDSLIMSVLATD